MAIEYPLGSPRYRGNSDVAPSRKFQGTLLAGAAVSLVPTVGSQPEVKLFDGSGYGGFAVHDLCTIRMVTAVIKTGEGICLRIKDGATLNAGEGFAVDNTTGEIVAVGAADSTTINGDVAAVGVIGLDENAEEVENCGLFNLYGGIIPAAEVTAPLAASASRTAKK